MDDWEALASTKQTRKIREFIAENDASVVGYVEVPRGLVVQFSLPRSPADEYVTALHLPEWCDITFSPSGSQLSVRSSWDERRKYLHKMQVAAMGSLKISREGARVLEGDRSFMVFR